jgi:phosphonate transport system permease protein
LNPELSLAFLEVAVRSMIVTVAYAVVASVLAGIIGVLGGALCCSTTWSSPITGGRDGSAPVLIKVLRLLLSLLRNVHEAVWVVLLVAVLGRDPLTGVLALSLPFGAITAKVVADAVDTAPRAPFHALMAAGSSRPGALVFGVAPAVAGDLGAYWAYRIECAVRSSTVLGAIGAGGIGFEIALSFQALRYEEIWTLLYVLIATSVGIDSLTARLRAKRRGAYAGPGRRHAATSVVIAAVTAFAASWWYLGLRPQTLLSDRSRNQMARFAGEAWPLRPPAGGWDRLGVAAWQSAQLSVMAILIAVAIALALGVTAVRVDGASWAARIGAASSRVVLVVLRTVPLTVWALVVLFAVRPGPVPGALALGLYSGGVLGRLYADVLETADSSVHGGLRALGASRVVAHVYATVPQLTPRFVALGAYRWGVAARDTVVVGVVGAAGLGRLLAEQSATFDEGAMATTVASLVGLSVVIDGVGSRLRRTMR